MKTEKCKGYLVGAEWPLASNPNIYTNPYEPVGCNNLFCHYCGHPVRSWTGFRLYAPTQAERELLYYIDDPAQLSFVKKRALHRLYSCLCWTDSIMGHDQLGFYEGTSSWDCAGHPAETENT